MVSRLRPADSSVAVIFTPGTAAPWGSVTIPVNVALAACWPNTGAVKQATSKNSTGRERDNAGVIIDPFRFLFGLVDAACNPVVDPGDDLSCLTFASGLSYDTNDRFRV